MTHIIIVNGKPRAGKDTFISHLTTILRRRSIHVDAFSSIDPVRDMLTAAGFDLRWKTEADRRLLAVVGQAVEDHSQWRTHQCLVRINDFAFSIHDASRSVMFLHIREPKNIDTIKAASAQFYPCLTVFLESDRAENVTSNTADAGVADMIYDHTFQNNGTIEDLYLVAEAFVTQLFPA